MRFYTGIGSRETPDSVLQEMTKLAVKLSGEGYTLRSGAAPGADSSFELGSTRSEIYLPWRGFNGHPSPLYHISDEALKMAARFHPAWHRCSQGAQKLHARNCYQVLGQDLKTPSEFVVCWTSDGKASGGTGQAMRIAAAYGIPIINFHR